jgi:spore coat polysaccharide biosynthesis predicted glycosyltransferase SpsG
LKRNQNILICPLEWGLGHAGRMIPLARKLKSMEHKVIIGTGMGHINFLRTEMPEMEYILFPGFTIRYSGKLPQYLIIMLKMPLLFYYSIKEHFSLKKIIRDHSVDIVISDSRIGLWNKKIKSVIIVHFPRVPVPSALRILEKPLLSISRFIIGKFTYCYIPDIEGDDNLTGRLSHDLELTRNTRFIGILSRFSKYESGDRRSSEKCHFMIILSGPEPQREILRNKLSEVLSSTGEKTIVLGGDPASVYKETASGNIVYISHLPEKDMAELILGSDKIITRSGYTTIMELVSLDKSAIIIPTPGQPEQEYLAQYLAGKGLFSTVKQSEIGNLSDVEIPVMKWSGRIREKSEKLLEKALTELLEK